MPPPEGAPRADAIFERLSRVSPRAGGAPGTPGPSLDAEAAVNVGPFPRRGRSRTGTEAAGHGFKPGATPTPSGISSPEHDDPALYMARSEVTSDFIVDRLGHWRGASKVRFPEATKPVLNPDNGPESHSRRTQFLERMPGFAREYRLDIELAYYPPHHSQYNPIERCSGILELRWNGSLLDSAEAVLGCAEAMAWGGGHPGVVLVEKG